MSEHGIMLLARRTLGPTDPGDDTAGDVPLGSGAGRLVVGTTVAGSAVALMTATIVNVALPTIARDLDASSSGQQWIVNAYLLTLASFILTGGALGDRYGRVRTYRIGVLWFGVASVACALAPATGLLIAARFLQGVGAALLVPGSLAIIESTIRHDDRGRSVGWWSGLTGIAASIGPLVGGVVVELSWRWVFVVNLPVAVLVLVLSMHVPESRDDTAVGTQLDLGGGVVTVLALGAASFALIRAAGGVGIVESVAALSAVIAIVALVVRERGRSHPMVPVDLFARRAFVGANAVTLLVYGGMGVMFFLLSIHLQVTLGWSPLEAGAAQVPVTLLMLALSSRAGDLAQRIGPRWPLTVGPFVVAAGMVLMSRVGPGDSFVGSVLPAATVFGLGLAATVAPVTSTALGTVPDDRSGAASGVNNAVARSGQLLAVAAVPAAVGLGGDALNRAADLERGFPAAMLVGAAAVAAGGLLAGVLLRSDDLADG